jgi:chromosome segregation ATPase
MSEDLYSSALSACDQVAATVAASQQEVVDEALAFVTREKTRFEALLRESQCSVAELKTELAEAVLRADAAEAMQEEEEEPAAQKRRSTGGKADTELVVEKLKEENRQLQAMIGQFQEQIMAAADNEQSEEELEGRLANALLQVQQLEDDLQEQQTACKQLEIDMQQAQAEREVLKQKHNGEVEALQSKLSEMQAERLSELKAWDVRKQTMQADHDLRCKGLTEKVHDLEVQVEKLQFEGLLGGGGGASSFEPSGSGSGGSSRRMSMAQGGLKRPGFTKKSDRRMSMAVGHRGAAVGGASVGQDSKRLKQMQHNVDLSKQVSEKLQAQIKQLEKQNKMLQRDLEQQYKVSEKLGSKENELAGAKHEIQDQKERVRHQEREIKQMQTQRERFAAQGTRVCVFVYMYVCCMYTFLFAHASYTLHTHSQGSEQAAREREEEE